MRSLEHKEKKPPIYKVMLHNDNYNRREYVVKILINVVKGFTVDDAVVVMQVRFMSATDEAARACCCACAHALFVCMLHLSICMHCLLAHKDGHPFSLCGSAMHPS